MDEQTAGKIPAKILDLIISRLGKILELADKGTGIPAALSDPVLRSTRLTLKKYADDHWDDMLLSIHKYVQSIPNPGKNLFSHLGKLLADFGKELASFLRYQDIGMVRQEEQWKIFDEITMTLAIWISHLPKLAKQPKELSSTFRMMKRFNARFPDRIPQALLK
ncbi:hypothetical protein PHMEG_00015832 [Phytophthora megakarya]|uniref:Uncharacterized protein n=1 Tax=Phytophthora megakarya TaxID=4795 RepID=A0A225W0R5_9STRA|nr:hypothetical protein PHMEG_00015832 [Phytophthora megakarya]